MAVRLALMWQMPSGYVSTFLIEWADDKRQWKMDVFKYEMRL
jgi:hypothetical protein